MLVQQVYKTTFLGEIDAMMITLDFFLCLSQLFTVFFFSSSRILLLLFLFVPKASDVSLYNDIIILFYYNYPLKFTMYFQNDWNYISIKFYVLDPEQKDNTLKEINWQRQQYSWYKIHSHRELCFVMLVTFWGGGQDLTALPFHDATFFLFSNSELLTIA